MPLTTIILIFQLVESLKIALKEWKPSNIDNESECLEVRSNDESNKVSGVEQSELRTSVKVFITNHKKEALQEAIDKCKCIRCYFITKYIYCYKFLPDVNLYFY